jgi:hypothetical protein
MLRSPNRTMSPLRHITPPLCVERSYPSDEAYKFPHIPNKTPRMHVKVHISNAMQMQIGVIAVPHDQLTESEKRPRQINAQLPPLH